MKFIDLQFKQHPNPHHKDGIQAIHIFPNGYGISVVKFPGSYGYEQGLYEVAVIKGVEENWEICCDTPITDDVIGHLNEVNVENIMEEVVKLPNSIITANYINIASDLNYIFELNDDIQVQIDYIEKDIEDSKFFIIENIFKYPDEIVEYLSTIKPMVWKENEQPSFNTIYFEDLKHHIIGEDALSPMYNLLSNLCGDQPERYDIAVTNLFRFNIHPFNNYHHNYWLPHTDIGRYTGIVYLNKDDDYNGTNIYNCIDHNDLGLEHYKPWYPKENYELIMTVPPRYNRLFFYNASKYYHGMNIYNDRYTKSEYRTNMVFNMNSTY